MRSICLCCRMITILLCATPFGASPLAALDNNGTRRTYELPEVPGAELSDAALEAAVAVEMDHDPLIDVDHIEVDAAGGIIRLTGAQPILIARDRATYVAETVRGVRQVINDIKVRSSREVDGRRLEADILYALLTDPATERSEFTVEATDNGDVVLNGLVDSGAERTIAENIIKSMAGVTSVTNDVEVNWTRGRADKEILADIRRMLQWDAYVDSGDIQPSVSDGIVTLTGSVSSAAEKRRALGLSWVTGVKHVNVVPLDVVAGLSNRQRNAGAPLQLNSDEAIAAAIQRALDLDPNLVRGRIGVKVNNRVVTLSGSVGNLRAKRIAARTPYGILGVASVRDRLQVSGAGLFEDDEISRRIQRSLAKNSVTADEQIRVRVSDGAVTLDGFTQERFSRRKAENLAAAVRGVRSVENDIKVDARAERLSHNPYVDTDSDTDTEGEDHRVSAGKQDASPIEENVRRELWWSPLVDEQQVTVSVDSAVATLSGVVGSEAERRAAIENAFQGGAVSVKDRLVVQGEEPR